MKEQLKLSGVSEVARKLGVSQSYVRHVRVAMGKPGARYLDPLEVRAWILAHPEFKCNQVKGRQWTPPQSEGLQRGDVGISDSRERSRGLRVVKLQSQEVLRECID